MFVLIVLGLVLLNGLFSMAEIALVSSRRSRLESLAAQGDKGAATAIDLIRKPTRFLSTVQIGITSCAILSGIFGEATLSEPLARELRLAGLSETTAMAAARFLVVAAVTYLSIIFGELVPKRIAQMNPESIARAAARPMAALAMFSRPLVWLLTVTTNAILRLTGVRSTSGSVTQEDIFDIVQQGSVSGAIETDEQTMIRNVIRLDDRPVSSLMIPRADVVWLDLSQTVNENLKRIRSNPYMVYPVCDGGPERLLGAIHAKDAVYALLAESEADRWKSVMPAIFVPESMGGLDAFRRFRNGTVVLAFVVDEYGEWTGVLALTDILEALTGDLFQGEGAEAVKQADGSWRLRGTLPALTLKDILELDSLPDAGGQGYNTVAGMLLATLHRIPRAGDRMEWGGWQFDVASMDGNRIAEVTAVKSQPGTGGR